MKNEKESIIESINLINKKKQSLKKKENKNFKNNQRVNCQRKRIKKRTKEN